MQKKKLTRAPGGGRKPLPPGQRQRIISVRIPSDIYLAIENRHESKKDIVVSALSAWIKENP